MMTIVIKNMTIITVIMKATEVIPIRNMTIMTIIIIKCNILFLSYTVAD